MSEQGTPKDTYPTVSPQELQHREDLAGRLATLESKMEFERKFAKMETTLAMLKWGIGVLIGIGLLVSGAINLVARITTLLST